MILKTRALRIVSNFAAYLPRGWSTHQGTHQGLWLVGEWSAANEGEGGFVITSESADAWVTWRVSSVEVPFGGSHLLDTWSRARSGAHLNGRVGLRQ